MAFYARPTPLVSPGDIFPGIPTSGMYAPLRILRKSKLNPPRKFGPQDLRRVFIIPDEAGLVPDLRLETKQGEEGIAATRVGPVVFLSWGSQVEADERDIATAQRPKGKVWLAAPVFSMMDIPEQAMIEDPETHERINIRAVVRANQSHNYFYLPPLPTRETGGEQYVDFRKIQPIGISFFRDAKASRVATLTEESLNLLFSRLMWFFTRAEYFFRPIACGHCGEPVAITPHFEGQNLDADPWE